MIKYITRLAIKLKRAISRRFSHFIVSTQLNEIGKDFICDENVLIYEGHNISLGSHVTLNRDVILQSCDGAKIEIGNNVVISYGVKVLTGNLALSALHNSKITDHNSQSVSIGNNIWIGANTILLPGITVADNIIIGAGSIVNKSLTESNCLYAGNPVKRIKLLNN